MIIGDWNKRKVPLQGKVQVEEKVWSKADEGERGFGVQGKGRQPLSGISTFSKRPSLITKLIPL